MDKFHRNENAKCHLKVFFLTSIHLLCVTVYTCNNRLDSVLSHHVGPGNGTRAIRLGSQFLYPLCHLTSPDTKDFPSKKDVFAQL